MRDKEAMTVGFVPRCGAGNAVSEGGLRQTRLPPPARRGGSCSEVHVVQFCGCHSVYAITRVSVTAMDILPLFSCHHSFAFRRPESVPAPAPISAIVILRASACRGPPWRA